MEERLKKIEEDFKAAEEDKAKMRKEVEEMKKVVEEDKEEQERMKRKLEKVEEDEHKTKKKQDEDRERLEDALGCVKAEAETAAQIIVNDARKEFVDIRGNMEGLKDMVLGLAQGARTELDGFLRELQGAREELDQVKRQATDTFLEVKAKIEELERKGQSGETKMSGFLLTKTITPKAFGGKVEEWRAWKDDAMDYFDEIQKGIREHLEAAGRHKPSADWRNQGKSLYRALKKLTDGDARKIVMSVKTEDGWEAWHALCQNLEAGINARMGVALSEVTGIMHKPAATPAETRKMIPEMERRFKEAEELMVQVGAETGLDDTFKKAMLLGIIDRTTRQMTANDIEATEGYQKVKERILRFVNNVTAGAGEVGGIGRAEDPTGGLGSYGGAWSAPTGIPAWGQQEEGADGDLNRMGNIQCHACGQFGHYARECFKGGKGKASKGEKGKGANYAGGFGKAGKGGKGGQKGEGKARGGKDSKGKGKGPVHGACWTCGGSHFQRDCPQGKGGSVRGLEGPWEAWTSHNEQDAPLRLTSLKKVPRKETEAVATGASGPAPLDLEDERDAAEEIAERVWELVRSKRSKKKARQKAELEAKDPVLMTWASTEMGEKEKSEELNIFKAVEPSGLNAAEQKEWELLELAVDSGANETVIGEEMLEGVETKEGPASRKGVKYEIANGLQIPNLGEKEFVGESEEGIKRALCVQVAEVNKALLSVSKVVKAGNTVVFDEEGSFIEDKRTGQRMWMREDGGMYMLKMWVRNPGF